MSTSSYWLHERKEQIMFQSILVAVDGSADAEQALTQAIDLAESQRSRLTLFSAVVTPPPVAYQASAAT